jgi:hypothetical protein
MINATNPTRDDIQSLARLVGYEVAMLNHYHETFEAFRTNVLLGAEQHALCFGHLFFTAMYEWYINSQLVSLRALRDPNRTQLNLATLLKMIERSDPANLAEEPSAGAVSSLIDDLTAARAQLHQFRSASRTATSNLRNVSTMMIQTRCLLALTA